MEKEKLSPLLLISVFAVATCGLIYELVAGTLASYLLGDSVTQFSTIIGVYLFSMGIGSFLSKYFTRNLLAWFVQIEILVGLVGGFSSAILFILFEQVESFRIVLYLLISLTGILVGLEIPLLLRILKDKLDFTELVSKVFTYDYIGALLASVIFPLLLVPHLGIMRTSFFFGILNVLVALLLCIKLNKSMPWASYLKSSCIVVLLTLLTGFVYSDSIMSYAESMAFPDKIIYAKSSAYQRIVITKNKNDLRLYLNNNLQFSSADEYRYHEALVHPAMLLAKPAKKVLVMGGGDGLAVREILKYSDVGSVTLVDLDKEMTALFSSNEMLLKLNEQSLLSKKVHIINSDAFTWLKKTNEMFDVIILDFPDPSNFSIGKLYSTAFYQCLKSRLNSWGAVVIQSTSPYVAPNSFWCVNNTLAQSGFKTLPYHVYVPSFGDWGYVMGFLNTPISNELAFNPQLKFMTSQTWQQMEQFPKDMAWRYTSINKLNNQSLVNYFEEEWTNIVQ